MATMNAKSKTRGFSLVELVIVIVIIGVIAAIAVPRISRGAKGAADSAMRGDLAALRNAIDLYAAEHSGTFPTVGKFTEMLTTYTDDAGADVGAPDATHIYGPYLRAIPGLPVVGVGTTGGKKGDTKVGAIDAIDVAWLYTVATGVIVANTGPGPGGAKDATGTFYIDY